MTFAQQFARSKGQPIDIDGKTVSPLYRRRAYNGLVMRVYWRKWVEAPVQGVSVSVTGGMLEVAGSECRDIVLWTDTAPREVTLRCGGPKVREISLWNCWRGDHGEVEAWVGNSGMIVETRNADALRFYCNSRPAVTFEDLVFDVVFEDRT